MPFKTALVVDDSRVARFGLIKMLQKKGLKVDTAISGEEALTYLQAHRPDVIFMDFFMPGMDGPDATRAIRANEQTARIPVIMCTSKETIEDQQKAMNAGVDGFMIKPASSERLDQIIQELETEKPSRFYQSHEPLEQESSPPESSEPRSNDKINEQSAEIQHAHTSELAANVSIEQSSALNYQYMDLEKIVVEKMEQYLKETPLVEQISKNIALSVAESISTDIAKNVAHVTAEEVAESVTKECSASALKNLEDLLDSQWEQKMLNFVQNKDFIAAVEAKSAETADVIATDVAQHLLNEQIKDYSNKEFQWLQQDIADLMESRLENTYRKQRNINIALIISVVLLAILFIFGR